MTTKTDIKRILSKGLTGKEAGKLALQDFWEEDHFREGFLSERDLSAIKASLKTPKDIQDYNSYMDTYKILDYTLKDAHIIALELQKRLSALSRLAMMHLLDATSVFELTNRPTIMTQKQYEDYKKEFKERVLNELNSLEDIIDRHAFGMDPNDIDWNKLGLDPVKYEDCPDDRIFTEWLKEEAPGLWKLIISEILELVREGRLKVIYITGKDKDQLESLWNKIKGLRDERSKLSGEDLVALLNPSLETKKQDVKIKKLDQQEEDLLQSLYKKGISKKDQAELIKALEKLLEGSLTKEEEESLILYTFSSGRDLYNSGLPEWTSLIDKTVINDNEFRELAIVVDPKPYKLDDKGHYKSIYKSYNELLTQERDFDIISSFTSATKQAKEEIKVFLAFQTIIDTLSEIIGIDFAEDMKSWIKDIEYEIEEYNRLKLTIESTDHIPEKIKETLPYLDINKFKPSAKTTKYLKERMSISLGDNWWGDVREAFKEDYEAMEAEDGQ